MKRDRVELENILLEIITNVKSKHRTVAEINRKLSELGILEGTFHSIAKGDTKIDEIGLELLCLLTQVLSDVTKNFDISPNIFFTEKELSTAKSYKDEIQNKVLLPFTLKNVIALSDGDSFVTKIDIKTLVDIYHSGLIDYDFETQRSPKYRKRNNAIIEVQDINLASVKEICDHILNGTYLPDTIRLNVYSDEEDALSYDQKTLQLSINVTTTILDGFHRLQGMVRALRIQPSLNLDMELSIKSYNTEKAKKFFGQINTVNIVNKARLRELKQEKHADSIVKMLQTRSDSDLRGRTTSGMTTSKNAGHLTTSIILSDAIHTMFQTRTRLEVESLTDYLNNFFNHLLGLFPEEFIINPNKFREQSFINDPLMFHGYIALAKRFRDEDIDLLKIKDVIDSLDLSRSNSDFSQMFGSTLRDTIKVKKELENFFNSVAI